MSAQAVNNTNLTNLDRDSLTTGFSPSVSYAYNAETAVVTVTDESDFPDGTFLEKTHVRVFDKFGGEVRGTIVEEPGSGVADSIDINVETLDRSKPLDITATVLGDDGKLVADGSAYNIGAAGELGSWDKQKNA